MTKQLSCLRSQNNRSLVQIVIPTIGEFLFIIFLASFSDQAVKVNSLNIYIYILHLQVSIGSIKSLRYHTKRKNENK